MRTMTRNHRGALTNLTRDFDAGECKLILDDRHNRMTGQKRQQEVQGHRHTVLSLV